MLTLLEMCDVLFFEITKATLNYHTKTRDVSGTVLLPVWELNSDPKKRISIKDLKPRMLNNDIIWF